MIKRCLEIEISFCVMGRKLNFYRQKNAYPLLDGESRHVVLAVESCLSNRGPALFVDVIESSRINVLF